MLSVFGSRIFGIRENGTASRKMTCLNGTYYPDPCAISSSECSQTDRPKMKIWGILSSGDEENGFGLFLDNECYALVLYYQDQIVALFDPYNYTLPELHETVEKVIQAIPCHPCIVPTDTVVLSQN